MASGRRSYSASPTALSVGPAGDNRFELSAAAGFRGPGALLVEVTTARDTSGNEDTSTTDDGATVLLSIPVQVGDDTPVLECPSTVIPISAGQEYDLDIANFCTVFTLDPRDAAGLSYEATWATALDGLDAGSPQGSVVPVSAAEDATRGGEAVLTVRAGESNTQEVRFRLAQAPPPTLSQVRVETMEAGTSRTYDLATYLQAGVAKPEPTIVSVRSQGNSGVRATTSGSKLTLTAAKDSRGVQASFTIVMSDVGSADPPPERVAQGRIQFEVVGTPSAPGAPRPFSKSQSETITMSWEPPSDDGGAPILYYNVKEQRKGAQQRCDTNTCVFRKLKNGGSYSFRVQAVNRVGPGEWSEESVQARADTEPGRVENIRMVDRGDGTITVAWDKPRTQTSKVLDYALTWPGGAQTVSGATSFAVPGLNNNEKYIFTVQARNKVGYSAPRSSVEMQPLGTPAASGCTVGDRPRGRRQPDRTQDRLGCGASRRSGTHGLHGQLHATARRPGWSRGARSWPRSRAPTAASPTTGSSTPTRVVAANSPTDAPATGRSPVRAPPSSPWAARPPGAAFSAVATGTSQEVQLQYTVPDSRGTDSKVEILVGGAGQQDVRQPDRQRHHARPGAQQRAGLTPSSCGCATRRPRRGARSASSRTCRRYGPLDGSASSCRPSRRQRQGRSRWTITGTSNGDPAAAAIQVDGGAPTQVVQRPAGAVVASATTAASRPRTSSRSVEHRGDGCATDRRAGVARPRVAARTRRRSAPPPRSSCRRGAVHRRRRRPGNQTAQDRGMDCRRATSQLRLRPLQRAGLPARYSCTLQRRGEPTALRVDLGNAASVSQAATYAGRRRSRSSTTPVLQPERGRHQSGAQVGLPATVQSAGHSDRARPR